MNAHRRVNMKVRMTPFNGIKQDLYKRVDMSMVSLKDRMTPSNGVGLATDHIHMSGNSYKPSKNVAPDQGMHISSQNALSKGK